MLQANIQKKAEVRTDGWTGYDNLHKLGYNHTAVPVRGNQAKTTQHLSMIHIVFGNLDVWLLGTHQRVSPVHLQGYLNEFVFRFYRRLWTMIGFDSVLKIAGSSEIADQQGLLRKRTDTVESSKTRLACANRIGIESTMMFILRLFALCNHSHGRIQLC